MDLRPGMFRRTNDVGTNASKVMAQHAKVAGAAFNTLFVQNSRFFFLIVAYNI